MAAVRPQVAAALAKVLGSSPMGRRPAGQTGEVMFRHSMVVLPTSLRVAYRV